MVAPVVSGVGGTASFTEGSAGVAAASAITVTDSDSANLAGATVRILDFVVGDYLDFTDQNGITGSWNPSTGILTLTGSASVADYQAALRSILFQHGGEANAGGTDTGRTILWQVSDGTANSNIGVTTVSVADGGITSGADTLYGTDINDVIDGLDGDDTIHGYGGNDILIGGAGADTLYGGDGNDTYYVDNTGDVADETGTGGTDTVVSSIDWTLAAGLENLTLSGSSNLSGTGNSADNVITGNSGDNTLSGGGGNDTLYGGAGDDTLDGSLMEGGEGSDTAVYDSALDQVYDFGSTGTDLVLSSLDINMNVLYGIENVTLTGSALNIVGDGAANVLTGNGLVNDIRGGGGDDILYGLGGDDHMEAQDGTDTLYGGDGDDFVDGGFGDDTIYGGDGADYLRGADGVDTMYGGDGNDTYVVENLLDVTTETGTGVDLVISRVSWTLGDNIENLTLGSAGDNTSGTGNSLDNIITGNATMNSLYGMGGADTLYGGQHDDTLYGGNGADTLDGQTHEDVLYGGDGDDILIGGASYDSATGGAGADTFLFKTGDLAASGDIITDLNFADGDIIDVSGVVAGGITIVTSFSNVVGQATLTYNSGTGVTSLSIDTDGNGVADRTLGITGNHAGTGSNLYTGPGDTDGGWILT